MKKKLGPRDFPFKAGTGFKIGDTKKADSALKVFEVLWKAFQDKHIAEEDIKHIFFYSISNQITYRESWKCGKFWSVKAWKQACEKLNTKGLLSEHVVPRSVVLNHALKRSNLADALDSVQKYSFDCVITKEEDKELTRKKLKSSTPNLSNPWERYKMANIKVLNVQYPPGKFFLDQEDRKMLEELNILVE
jgi:hypothetical protein